MTDHPDDPQLSRLIDGDLGLVERSAVRSHLEQCPACAHRHAGLVDAAARFRAAGPLEWSAGLTAATLDRIEAVDRRSSVAASWLALAGALAVTALVVSVTLEVGLSVVHAAFALVGSFGTFAAPSPGGTLLALVVAAVVAALAVYPLARWR